MPTRMPRTCRTDDVIEGAWLGPNGSSVVWSNTCPPGFVPLHERVAVANGIPTHDPKFCVCCKSGTHVKIHPATGRRNPA